MLDGYTTREKGQGRMTTQSVRSKVRSLIHRVWSLRTLTQRGYLQEHQTFSVAERTFLSLSQRIGTLSATSEWSRQFAVR